MKTWTMPRIEIEAYAVNEYVAACDWSGSSLIISCEQGHGTGADWSNPTHDYISGACSSTVIISGTNWNSFNKRGTWYSSDGEFMHVGGANVVPDENHGDYVYYVYTTTHAGETWLIWDTYRWQRGEYREEVQKHRTRYGSGNPES